MTLLESLTEQKLGFYFRDNRVYDQQLSTENLVGDKPDKIYQRIRFLVIVGIPIYFFAFSVIYFLIGFILRETERK